MLVRQSSGPIGSMSISTSSGLSPMMLPQSHASLAAPPSLRLPKTVASAGLPPPMASVLSSSSATSSSLQQQQQLQKSSLFSSTPQQLVAPLSTLPPTYIETQDTGSPGLGMAKGGGAWSATGPRGSGLMMMGSPEVARGKAGVVRQPSAPSTAGAAVTSSTRGMEDASLMGLLSGTGGSVLSESGGNVAGRQGRAGRFLAPPANAAVTQPQQVAPLQPHTAASAGTGDCVGR